MILENGVIRTLDPSLPKAGALAIAGELVAGGVGTHETALASPERVDLGGRCVLPGFTDAHVHFPTWALAQHQVRLEGTSSLDEALARVGDAVASVPEGRWLRGLGWRSGDWSPAVEPTKEALDAVTGDVPAALMARDYHSLWLNSAALALGRTATSRFPAGSSSGTSEGEPTGVLREECAWHFRDVYVRPTHEEMVDASREGIRLANSRGVVAIHDKDGWLGALAVFQELQAEGALTLRVWQSLPARPRRRARGDRHLGRPRRRVPQGRLHQGLHGRDARLADSADARRLGGRDHQPGGARGHRDAVCACRLPGRRPRDRQPGEPARRSTPSRRRRRSGARAGSALESSTPSSSRRRTCRASGNSEWRRRCSSATRRRTATSLTASGATSTAGAYAYRSLLDAGTHVANGSDAPIEELDPLAGIAAGVLRTIDDRPAWHPEQRVTVEEAVHATCVAPAWLEGAERRRGRLVPGRLADLVVLDRDPFECPPEELRDVGVVATMAGGRWVHNPPPWD